MPYEICWYDGESIGRGPIKEEHDTPALDIYAGVESHDGTDHLRSRSQERQEL